MFLKLDTNGALYDQIYRALRGQILGGRLLAATRVPATRDLALELGVSRNVAIMAYRQLLDEGYLTARKGAGTFVARELPRHLTTVAARRPTPARTSAPVHLSSYARRVREASHGVQFTWAPRRDVLPYDFRYGPPSFTDFPHETWCRVVSRRARRVTLRDLDYGQPEGLPALREVIADYVSRARAIACTPEQILVVNGSQQALDLAARVLVDPGDAVLMEEPHYRGARTVMRAAGAKIDTIAVDDHGLRTSELLQRRTTLSRLAIVTPSHQFPTGAVMPLSRRLDLLTWARRAGACIFEDDYDSEYRYSGRPIEALAALDDSGSVLYAATFSKVMFPSLRLGYMILPERLIEPIRSVKALMDTGGPTLAQAALVDFIREGHFERHLHRTRTRNAGRRAAILDAIERHLGDRAQVSGINAGLHLMLWLRDLPASRSRELRMRAARAGVGVYSVDPFYLNPPRRVGLLLGYSSMPEKQIAEGIRRFAAVVNSL